MKEQKRIKNLTIANIIFFTLVIIVNYLGATGYFNGMSQQSVSRKFPTLITPAGFTFSIWGVIYTLVLISLIYLFLKRKDERISKIVELISYLYILNSIFNIGWIISFSYELIGLSTVFIFLILITLMLIIERLYKNRKNILYTIPGISFTLYASWVFIATFVNIAAFLVKQKWSGFGISESIWTIIIIIFTISFAIIYEKKFKNAIFPISISWGYWGIYSAYKSGEIVAELSTTIQSILLMGVIILISISIFVFIKNGLSVFPKEKE